MFGRLTRRGAYAWKIKCQAKFAAVLTPSSAVKCRVSTPGSRARKLPAVPWELGGSQLLGDRNLERGEAFSLLFSLSAYAAAGETSRAMRLALLISATRRS